MTVSWIVAANAGLARVFSQHGVNGDLEEIHDMANKDAQLRTADIESDQIGQRAASKSKHSVGAPTQPSGYQPHQSPDEHRTELFGREVAEFLLRGHHDHEFQQLILISSPEFLGLLRQLLDSKLTSLVKLAINKDYTHLSTKELRDHIKTHEQA
jgi:protein required for attachment to host cells